MQRQNIHPVLSGTGRRSIAHPAASYRSILTTLALRLGVRTQESYGLVESVISTGSGSFNWQKEHYTMKTWLAKMLVRDCVFHLNSALFSKAPGTNPVFDNDDAWEHKPSGLPLRSKLVYILFEVGGFNEMEVAQILNSTALQVKQELARTRNVRH